MYITKTFEVKTVRCFGIENGFEESGNIDVSKMELKQFDFDVLENIDDLDKYMFNKYGMKFCEPFIVAIRKETVGVDAVTFWCHSKELNDGDSRKGLVTRTMTINHYDTLEIGDDGEPIKGSFADVEGKTIKQLQKDRPNTIIKLRDSYTKLYGMDVEMFYDMSVRIER